MTQGLQPARIEMRATAEGIEVPYAPDFGDVYHAQAGAWAQARHVFLAGNGLPGRWQDRERFVIVETGFGLGNNFLATWAAWLADPRRCKRLYVVSIEKHPLSRADLARVHAQRPPDDDAPQATALLARLSQAWPVMTPGMHVLSFDEPDHSGVTLMLGWGDVRELLPQCQLQANAFFLDGFAPAKNADMWDTHLLSRLSRLAAPDATVATWSVARQVRDALSQAGFVLQKTAGFQGKRDMLQGQLAPRHAQHAAHRNVASPFAAAGLSSREVTVIGAGLAGCAAAWALSREGWRVTVLEQHAQVASQASGNAGGLFHSIVHGSDGVHSRLHRAAALLTARVVQPWLDEGTVSGQCEGLIRLDKRLTPAQAHALIEALGWPEEHLSWLTQEEASARIGLDVPSGGWWFRQGGWLNPSQYAHRMLQEAQATGLVNLLENTPVAHMALADDGNWVLQGAEGQSLHRSRHVVLCLGSGAMPWLAQPPLSIDGHVLPHRLVRGQVSLVAPQAPGIHMPRHPVAGQGYVIALPDGRLLCGATTHSGDMEADTREADHQHNLAQAHGLGAVADVAPLLAPGSALVAGRVGWRVATPDRLPLVGPLPHMDLMAEGGGAWPAQVRRVPRWQGADDHTPGLYMLGGLGSRGITWSALCGQLLAHWVTGSPCPIEGDLRDALDVARFVARAARKKEGG